eukprot:1062660-Pyramimonas_sp.AAC.1
MAPGLGSHRAMRCIRCYAELKASMVEITLTVSGSELRKTFPRADGAFKFSDVPPGTHLIEVVALGYFFPPVRDEASTFYSAFSISQSRFISLKKVSVLSGAEFLGFPSGPLGLNSLHAAHYVWTDERAFKGRSNIQPNVT